jgi:hypothetical protein
MNGPSVVTHCDGHVPATPGCCIRVRKVGEAGVLPARMVKPGFPGIDGSSVSDLSDFDAMLQQVVRATSRSATARQTLRSDPKGALVSPRQIWIEQLEPGGVSCAARKSFGE